MKLSTCLVALSFAWASLVVRDGNAAPAEPAKGAEAAHGAGKPAARGTQPAAKGGSAAAAAPASAAGDPPPGAARDATPAKAAAPAAAPSGAPGAAPAGGQAAGQAAPGHAAAEPAGAPAAGQPAAGQGNAASGASTPASTPGAAAGAAATAGATPAAAAKLDGATYAVRLRDLEARVDELKEQIRRSHTRLSLLSDTILSGGVGGSRSSILFQNDMSGAFSLTRALVVLDGVVQYNKTDDSGGLSGQKQIPIFKGAIAPGEHTLQVLLRLRGHGYGVFSYLRGYQFEVKQSHSFSVMEGKEMALDVVAWEKGGVTTPLEQRPAVRFLEHLSELKATAAAGEAEAPPSRTGGERE